MQKSYNEKQWNHTEYYAVERYNNCHFADDYTSFAATTSVLVLVWPTLVLVLRLAVLSTSLCKFKTTKIAFKDKGQISPLSSYRTN